MRHLATTRIYADTDNPILRSADLVATLNGQPIAWGKCSLGIVPADSAGRQTHGGPIVPGPWGFATTHASVIDSSGQAAREFAAAERVELGEPFTVEGLPGTWTLRAARQFEGDGAVLAPYEPQRNLDGDDAELVAVEVELPAEALAAYKPLTEAQVDARIADELGR